MTGDQLTHRANSRPPKSAYNLLSKRLEERMRCDENSCNVSVQYCCVQVFAVLVDVVERENVRVFDELHDGDLALHLRAKPRGTRYSSQ